MTSIHIIVFLPLLAALVAGLGQRFIGAVAAKTITTAGLFTAALLSWPIFIGFLTGTETAYVAPVMRNGFTSGTLTVRLGIARRCADRRHAGGDHHRVRARPSL